MPGVRVSAAPSSETYGAQVGETLAKAGATLYQHELWNADSAAVLDAEAKASEAQLNIMQGLTTIRGKDAANAPMYASTEFEKANVEIQKGLTNDRQRGMYEQVVRHKRDALNTSALRHFNTENEQFLESTYKTNIEQSVNVARANVESPVSIAYEKDLQAQKVRERAARLGYGGTDQEALAVTEVHSRTNTEVIKGLLDKEQDQRAKSYYEAMLKQETTTPEKSGTMQFTAQDRDAVGKMLDEGSTRGESRRLSQALIQKYGIDTPEQHRALLAATDAITNDKVADATRQRLEHLIAVESQRKAETYTATYANAAKIIDETALKVPERTAREIVPVSLWQGLHPEQQHALELQVDRMRKPEKTHDPNVWAHFSGIPEDRLAGMRLEQVTAALGGVDNTHYDHGLTLWRAARNKQDGKADDKGLSVLTNHQRAEQKFTQSGIVADPNKPRAKWSDSEILYHSLFMDQADIALSGLPKDAKPEQIQKTLDDLSDRLLKQKFKVDPGFFSRIKEVPAIGLNREQGRVYVPLKEIPQDQQDRLRGMILQSGKKVTTDKLERAYAVKKRTDLPLAEKERLLQDIMGE